MQPQHALSEREKGVACVDSQSKNGRQARGKDRHLPRGSFQHQAVKSVTAIEPADKRHHSKCSIVQCCVVKVLLHCFNSCSAVVASPWCAVRFMRQIERA
jgi:hypothetical protein